MNILDKILGKSPNPSIPDALEKIIDERYTTGPKRRYGDYEDTDKLYPSLEYHGPHVMAYCTTAHEMSMSCSTGRYDYPPVPYPEPDVECKYCGNISGLRDARGNCISCGAQHD